MDKFNEYLKKYQEDPNNVNVCRYLHMEYIKRGLEGPANEMKAHIERLGYKALNFSKPKKKNWRLGCLLTIFIGLFFIWGIMSANTNKTSTKRHYSSNVIVNTHSPKHTLKELESMRDEANALIKDGEAQLTNPFIDSATRTKLRNGLKELYELRRNIERDINYYN